jgi:Mce-associated membrane protein
VTGLAITEFSSAGVEAERGGRCDDLTTAAQAASTSTAAHDGQTPSASCAAADTDAAVSIETDTDGASGRHRRPPTTTRQVRWSRLFTRSVLPCAALGLAVIAGFLNWADGSARQSALARVDSVQAASDSTAALLSYQHNTVDNDVAAARQRLTGNFKDAYTSLAHDVVIPGAKQKQISVTATVPAAASLSASESHAVVLVFVDQTLTTGNQAPSNTSSSVRVTLDKIDGRWLISQFDPI